METEEGFYFDVDPYDDHDDPVTSFEEIFQFPGIGTSATSAAGKNAMFYFPTAAFGANNTYSIFGNDGVDQMAFDGLDDVHIHLETTSTGTGTVTYYDYQYGASATTSSSISFSGIEQILLADTVVPSLSSGTVSASDASGSSDGINDGGNAGDVMVFPGLGAGENAVAWAGSASADTINVNAALNTSIGGSGTLKNALIFGKGGGDTFNISAVGERIMIGGITTTDNNDNSGSDGVPDANINLFSYSSLDLTTLGLNIDLFGELNHTGADAFVGDRDTNGSGLSDMLWDVGSLTGSVDADYIYAGNFVQMATIAGGGGTDTVDFSRISAAITMTSGMKVSADVDSDSGTNDTVIGSISTDVEVLIGTNASDTMYAHASGTQLEGGSGADTLNGSSGVDTLIGGTGADNLNGGGGADVYKYTATTDGSTTAGLGDTITSANFVSGTDSFQFLASALSLTAGNDLALTAVAFNTNETTTLNALATAGAANKQGYAVELTGSTFGATLYENIDGYLEGGAATGAALIIVDNGTDTKVLYDPDTATATTGSIVEIATVSGLATGATGGISSGGDIDIVSS